MITQAEVERASRDWGANDGPAALAAATGMPLDGVRKYLPEFEKKRHVNPAMMYGALRAMRATWKRSRSIRWPARGLVRIQWHGWWTAAHVSRTVKNKRTHWVAARSDARGTVEVFSSENFATAADGWVTEDTWAMMIAPWLAMGHPGADGNWSMTHVIEVAGRDRA